MKAFILVLLLSSKLLFCQQNTINTDIEKQLLESGILKIIDIHYVGIIYDNLGSTMSMSAYVLSDLNKPDIKYKGLKASITDTKKSSKVGSCFIDYDEILKIVQNISMIIMKADSLVALKQENTEISIYTKDNFQIVLNQNGFVQQLFIGVKKDTNYSLYFKSAKDLNQLKDYFNKALTMFESK